MIIPDGQADGDDGVQTLEDASRDDPAASGYGMDDRHVAKLACLTTEVAAEPARQRPRAKRAGPEGPSRS
ncbi:hypothetical protein GW17_00042135 [Ensete ventricosum]|nr:hypothetical protein GW17_00042135 [Ensete ventricosum]